VEGTPLSFEILFVLSKNKKQTLITHHASNSSMKKKKFEEGEAAKGTSDTQITKLVFLCVVNMPLPLPISDIHEEIFPCYLALRPSIEVQGARYQGSGVTVPLLGSPRLQ
jgi:hypothetical protein